MRWRNGRKSTNIEDRRRVRMSRTIKGGGIGVLLLALVGLFFGIDPSGLLQRNVQIQTGSSVQSTQMTSSDRVTLTKHLTRPA